MPSIPSIKLNKFVIHNINKSIIIASNQPGIKISNKVEQDQIKLISNLRKSRNNTKVKDKLRKIEQTCKTKHNLISPIIEDRKSTL